MPESVNTIYRTLFSVKLIHSGYETTLENFLQKGISIKADSATMNLFRNYNMGYRFFNDTLTCFLRCVFVSPPALLPVVPALNISKPIQLRFLLQNSSDFFAKTYIAAAGSKKVYRFSNRVNNSSGSQLFLNDTVAAFSAAADYDAGTIVQDSGNLYASLLPMLATDGIALSNSTYWKLLQPVEQVVSNADLADAAVVQPEENCLAVIDIFNTGTSNSSYQLFDGSGALQNPAPLYTLPFKSRN